MGCHPKVLIIGAGIGGLLLAILLWRAGIDYEIFERAAEFKSLGSAMVTGPNILPVFEQLDLLEQVEKIAKSLKCLNIYNYSLEKLGTVEANTKERAGCYSMAFALPPHKIHMSKKVLAMQEVDEGVKIRCSDNSSFVGDILVGADGAYSGVRQSLYKQLAREKLLPKNDEGELSMRYICLVGTTEFLDPEKHPYLMDEFSHFEIVLAKDSSESIFPSASQGAINAMQDATILANCINEIKSLTVKDISTALQDYQDQRYQFAKTQFETSKRFAVIMSGQTWSEAVIRKLVLSYMPKSLNQKRQARRVPIDLKPIF
ncbi:hypothetical protein BC939DRAFT_475558 [Gamsiella multidivaricata]|uniref:uncharacterized protein n=1 Tax=Gamsiella multidivaricata TaxID=101098 RepID=UPI002220D45E|nr:uncharacterized protein BC939DRAFT_475558 [Gamsiella multidivaricata]KAI7826867.1 hypothetical protein BC939DRAFT_475558 [Gamsiella multidivaricata]